MPCNGKSRWKDQSSEDIIWLAGLLEGEGCFRAHKNRNRETLVALVALKMTDEDVVCRAAKIMCSEGKFHMQPRREEHHKDQWRCVIYGQTAKDVMRAVLPYMGTRRSAKIREVLECAF